MLKPFVTYECLKGFHGDCGADACNCACHGLPEDDEEEDMEEIF